MIKALLDTDANLELIRERSIPLSKPLIRDCMISDKFMSFCEIL